MSGWIPGAILLAAGIAWLTLRVTIEKKAVTGSWWSHLVKELAIIRDLPVIGFIWRLLPLLLITAGVLWMSGLRPPGMGGDERQGPNRTTLCGDPEARPETLKERAWREYTCTGRKEAGASWPRCLPRGAYTTQAGRGCPGRERCCPPR